MGTRGTCVRNRGTLRCFSYFLGAAVVVAMGSEQTWGDESRPNIVLILADDVGLPWVSCYGADSLKTPHIDALAASGVRFERCYATPFCGPSRCQLVTGRYPFRTGGIGNGAAARVAAKNEAPIPRLLRDAGYVTGMCGKWSQMTGDLSDWGFSEYITSDNPAGHFWERTYLKNGDKIEHEEEVYYPDVCHRFALEFFERYRDRPFFFYYSSHFTHAPIVRTPDSKSGGPLGPSDEAYFDDNLAYLDKQVGEVIAELQRLGLRDKTLVLFAGDNGSTMGHKRAAGLDGRRVLGGKGSLLEGGARVPLIASWPGTTSAGTVCSDLVDFSDFHATLRDVAGISRPADLTFDGISFAPRLRGEVGTIRQWAFVQLQGDWYACDHRWKLTQRDELFDLRDAPFAEHPVPRASEGADAAAARERLRQALASLNPTAGFNGRPMVKRERRTSRDSRERPARKSSKPNEGS